MMEKRWIVTGLVLIILAIILGAFGAHGLKKVTSDEAILGAFDTATKYQFFQGLGFLIIPFILNRFSTSGKAIFWLMILGTLFFSGSIYGLTFSKVHGHESLSSIVGPMTPIGGLLMILGWTFLVIQVIRSSN
jgi:uncharacterized membrane protein YgdD (TMEM256/DUF423 family)